MKHRVRVTLVAETTVEIDVEAAEGEDPTDLTPAEEDKAVALVKHLPDWIVDDVELIAARNGP